jgi:RNA polymerase sigma factor (sigma-70 family)
LEKEEDRRRISECLRALRSDASIDAWKSFLDDNAAIVLQIAGLFERDKDKIADCFVFICEQLCQNNFRRLQQFRPDGAASFATWLRAVARRLCIDWHRREFGRSRIFESIERLSAKDQAMFRLIYEEGISQEAAFAMLAARNPGLSRSELDASCERVRSSLTPRQLWLISIRKPRLASLEGLFKDEQSSYQHQISDPAPDPEKLAAQSQQRAALDRALANLSASDRLLVRLRYEQELTLEQVARLSALPDPQTADRRLKQILAGLRKALGKRQPASV